MGGAFARDVLRTVWLSRRRFLLIAAICMLGVTMFVGVRAACENLRASADEFFDAQRLYDVSVQSTLGLTGDDVKALAALDGVGVAEGSWSETAYTQVGDARAQVSVMAWEQGGMNEPYLLDGRLPEAAGEVAVTSEFLEDSGLSLGDAVTFSADPDGGDGEPGEAGEAAGGETAEADGEAGEADGEDDFGGDVDVSSGETSEQFASGDYVIVGSVIDPTSVNAKHGSSSFRATGARYSFFVSPASVDPDVADVYSVVYLSVEGASALSGFSGDYDERVAAVTEAAEGIKAEREEARTAQVRDDATEQVDEAEREVNAELADAQAQIDDAQAQIDDAIAQVEEGRAELASQRASLEEAQRELDEGAALLDEARARLDEGDRQLDDAEALLPGGQDELDAAREELAAAREEYERQAEAWPAQREQLASGLSQVQSQIPAAEQAVSGLRDRLGELEAQEDPDEAQIAEVRGQLEAAEGALDLLTGREAELSGLIEQGDAAMRDAPGQLDASEAGLDEWQSGLDQISAGRAEAERGRRQLEQQQAQLDAAQAQIDAAWPLLEDGEAQLDAGEAEALEGQAELDERREEFERGKQEALERIEDARRQVDELESATWYVQDRGAISSYASIDSDAGSIEAIGTVFPVIFLTVAILVSLTTASRMVEEDRGLIGLYKALGYSRATIMSKYVAYTLGASLAGGAVGAVLGFVALPSFLATVFEVMYTLPAFTLHFDAGLCALAMGMFCVGISLATVLTCRGELAEQPASLMRPRAPKAGARILLERVGPLWRRMSFLNKVTARNLFRYKRRFAMTVFGVAGCTALMIIGFAISDSVQALSDNQYGAADRAGVYDYDLMAVVTDPDDLVGLAETLTGDDGVTDYVAVLTDSLTVEHDGRKETVQLMVVPDGFDLEGYVELRPMRTGGLPGALGLGGTATEAGDGAGGALALAGATAGPDGAPGTGDEGVLVTYNAAEVLGFGVGDEVSMRDTALREATARVDGVVANYLGNVVYMTEDAYERLFGVAVEPNAVLAHLSGDASAQIAFADELARDPDVRQVTSVEKSVRDFEANFMLINYVVVLLVCLAAGLSFVVLFTLATTNISERERELATIKVLGFRRREVRTYVNKETVVLTLIGTVAGVPLGAALSHLLTYVLVMPSMYFAVEIHPLSFVWSCAFSLLFAFVVNVICNRSLDRVDMVAALKSAE